MFLYLQWIKKKVFVSQVPLVHAPGPWLFLGVVCGLIVRIGIRYILIEPFSHCLFYHRNRNMLFFVQFGLLRLKIYWPSEETNPLCVWASVSESLGLFRLAAVYLIIHYHFRWSYSVLDHPSRFFLRCFVPLQCSTSLIWPFDHSPMSTPWERSARHLYGEVWNDSSHKLIKK